MNAQELDDSLIELEKLGIVRIDKKPDDDDTVISTTAFGHWLKNMGIEQAYLSMPPVYQKIVRNAYDDPNGQFDPNIFDWSDAQ